MTDIHLYGIDGWENLYTDLSTAVEHWIDDCCWPEDDPVTQVVVFTEWDTVPIRNHMPDVDRVLEYIHEYTCENGCVDEGFCDKMEGATRGPDVVAAMDAVLDLIGSKNPYRMADDVVRTIGVRVTWTDTDNKIADWEIVDG
jgi:hypothetical protein